MKNLCWFVLSTFSSCFRHRYRLCTIQFLSSRDWQRWVQNSWDNCDVSTIPREVVSRNQVDSSQIPLSFSTNPTRSRDLLWRSWWRLFFHRGQLQWHSSVAKNCQWDLYWNGPDSSPKICSLLPFWSLTRVVSLTWRQLSSGSQVLRPNLNPKGWQLCLNRRWRVRQEVFCFYCQIHFW